MATKPKEGEQIPQGHQGHLIDVEPENVKVITRCARAYKHAQRTRSEALAEEVKHKKALIEVVKEAGVTMVEGQYRLSVDGLAITITPRDELVRVKEEAAGEANDD